MSILDAFKQDCQENGNSICYDAETQAEVDKQMKAMAEYNANPAVLDSQIKFNEEEIPFDERAISKQLYIEEDGQYPAESDTNSSDDYTRIWRRFKPESKMVSLDAEKMRKKVV